MNANRLEILDGDRAIALSLEALLCAVLSVLPAASQGLVLASALKLQAQLDTEPGPLQIRVNRILPPTNHPGAL